jgi:hypothetical protein
MGIIAYYINEDNLLDSIVLVMKEIQGSHTGEVLSTVVMEVINDWGIASKLGYIVTDNASNNDTMMTAISTGMFPTPNLPYLY